MSNYSFNDNTLLHCCGVNLASFVSIMENGIVSKKYASDKNISFSRNFDGSNLDDSISCVRCLYVNRDIPDSSYSLYVKKGISFIVEDVDFIYDKGERFIHRSDEVLVKDYIPVSKIKGIIIPEDFMNLGLDELSYIKENSTKYANIRGHIKSFKNFICSLNGGKEVEFDDFDRELYFINQSYINSSDDDKLELKEEFKDVICDLNYDIGNKLNDVFSNILGSENVTLGEVVKYLNSCYLNLPIYHLSSKNKGKLK